MPDLAHLLTIANRSGLSLDWLLTGRGQELAEPVVDTPEGRVVAAIEAELRAGEDATPEEFEAAWVLLQEVDSAEPEGRTLFRLAVDAVRPVYSAILWRVKADYLLQRQASEMARRVLEDHGVEPDALRPLLAEFAAQVGAATAAAGQSRDKSAPGNR